MPRREQDGEWLETDELAANVVDRWLVEPVEPAKDHVELAPPKTLERRPDSAAEAAAKLEPRSGRTCGIQDAHASEPSLAELVDDDRPGVARVQVAPQPVVHREQLACALEQLLAVRCQ